MSADQGRLTLTLRHGDAVQIGEATVTVLFARRGATRLLIAAPRDVEINRTKETRDEPDGGGSDATG